MVRFAFSTSIIALALSGGSSALAQTQDAVPPAQRSDDIVVTAQRTESKLERTPVAVAVLTSTELEKQVVTTQADLQSAIAGLLVRDNSNATNYSLRGQTVDTGTGSAPAVAVYLNEVPTDAGDNPASILYDLQSVQVLKGPQGTLFGRNSTGGAILYTTAQPEDDFGGYVKVRVGDYHLRAIDGAVNLPISDTLAIRFAGAHEQRGGYFTNLFDDSHPGRVNRDSGRITVKWTPGSVFENNFFLEYSTSHGSNSPNIVTSYYTPGSTNNGIPLNFSLLGPYSPALDALIPGAWGAFLAAHPNADPLGIAHAIDAQAARDPHIVDIDGANFFNGRSTTISNITTWDVGDAVQLKNIFGYSRSKTRSAYAGLGVPFPVVTSAFFQDRETFTEELQLVGKALDDRLSFVTGVYFLDSKYDNGAGLSVLDLSPVIPPTAVNLSTRTKTRDYAVYAQGTYDLSAVTGLPGLGATVGVRYTDENLTNSSLPGSLYYNFPGMVNVLQTGSEKWSYQFGLQEQLGSGLLLYAVTRRSFRGGGFIGSAPHLPGDASQGGAMFHPETATDFEAGAKFKSAILSFNFAAYTQTTKNVQRRIYATIAGGPPAAFTINVPESRVRGFELDGRVRPAKWLSFGGALAYTDAEFTKNEATVFGSTTLYGPYPDTPEWAGSLYAEAIFPLSQAIGDLSLRGDVFVTSKSSFSSLGNSTEPGTVIDGYALVKLRVAMENVGGQPLTIAANLKNLFDKEYFAGGIGLGSTLGVNGVIPGEPRTFSVEASYRF